MTLLYSSAKTVVAELARPQPYQHRYYLRLQTPTDVYNMSQIVACFFPDPEGVFTGVYELLLNAVEHGNLELGSQDKYNHICQGTLLIEMERRIALPEYAGRAVEVEIIESPQFISVSIKDDGKGFDWKSQLDKNHNDSLPHGRGIWIAQQSGFDIVRFNAEGNCVTCICYRSFLHSGPKH